MTVNRIRRYRRLYVVIVIIRCPGRVHVRGAPDVISNGLQSPEASRHSGDVHSGGQYTYRTNSGVKGTVCALLYTLLMLSWYIT